MQRGNFDVSLAACSLTVLHVQLRGGSVRHRSAKVTGVARMQQQLMGRPGMMSRGGHPMQVNAVQDGIARGTAERLPLTNSLFVDLAVHHDHHETGDPEGNRGTNHRVRSIHLELAHLIHRHTHKVSIFLLIKGISRNSRFTLYYVFLFSFSFKNLRCILRST